MVLLFFINFKLNGFFLSLLEWTRHLIFSPPSHYTTLISPINYLYTMDHFDVGMALNEIFFWYACNWFYVELISPLNIDSLFCQWGCYVILETLVVEVCDKMTCFSAVNGQNERWHEKLRVLCVISMESFYNFAAKYFYSVFRFSSPDEEIMCIPWLVDRIIIAHKQIQLKGVWYTIIDF